MDVKFLPLYVAGNSAWTQDAECAKPGMPGMFPHVQDEEGIELAKDTCARCPVSDLCLTEALARGEQFGVWGGLLVEERTLVRRNTVRRQNKAAKRAKLLSEAEADQARALDFASELVDGAA